MNFAYQKPNYMENNVGPRITFSVISHRQAMLLQLLLGDLASLKGHAFEVLVTINVPEDEPRFERYPFPIHVIRNQVPMGFGANHNAAFKRSQTDLFIIVNPDVRIYSLDIDKLLLPFQRSNVGAVAPMVISDKGDLEDNARRFPTIFRLIQRLISTKNQLDYNFGETIIDVDWVAGMFVVFRRDVFASIGGFDDKRFYMYFEDVDICRRIQKNGQNIVFNPMVKITHSAQRASRKNFQHLRWHIISAIRYAIGI
jgi:N-acetylglucosaminyl-diphospho-decaprenol L-rhamnosyltransferase